MVYASGCKVSDLVSGAVRPRCLAMRLNDASGHNQMISPSCQR